MKTALVLCSGGIDSSVLSYYAKKRYGRVILLFFDYGQRPLQGERVAVRHLSKKLGSKVIEIKIPRIDSSGKAKKSKTLVNTKKESDSWYFPFRNTIFISHAVSIAEGLGKVDILLGFKCEGKESYPDTTKAYVKSMNRLVLEATNNKKIKILSPFIELDKEDIISLGEKLGVDFSKTISCYCSNISCGECLACRLRKAGFYWANIKDPTRYSKKK